MAEFRISDTDFVLNGSSHRILSGAIHYFRVHPDYWRDRIHKARLMGLNTVETYVAWNSHEPRKGDWDTQGWNDLGGFLDLIAEEGMHAIVRPGPYICAEWHNGGLPVWLTSMPNIKIRSSNRLYMTEVQKYLARVYEIVAPRQIDRGGPVVLVQIENEYGAFGSDNAYLDELVRITRSEGIIVPLTTVDQPTARMLNDGRVSGAHMTGSFGSRAVERLAVLREHQPTGPLMCSEFWDGWFDWWGSYHHTTSPAEAAAELDALLSAGASVNLYMFHGGTNFGATNGANDKGRYLPMVTSYDYSAPLDEAGNATEKYNAFRAVIAKYSPVPEDTVAPARVFPSFDVPLRAVAQLGHSPLEQVFDRPPTFEDLDHLGPLVQYDVLLPNVDIVSDGDRKLCFDEIRDMAWVSVDGVFVGRLSRTAHERTLVLPAGERLTVLIEEQGRVCYGQRLGESKGIIGPVTLGGGELRGWTVTLIDLKKILTSGASGVSTPLPSAGSLTVYRGYFDIADANDLYVATGGWGKGYVAVNGFVLGRYWRNGPQQTLYVPGPALRLGRNEISFLELEGVSEPYASFVERADLGPIAE